MSRSRRLVVATVNTYFGRAIVEDGGLDAVAHADVLLMQELFSPSKYGLVQRLQTYGFELLAVGGHFGLGIALRSESAFAPALDPPRSTVLQQVGSIERRLISRFADQHLEYSDLGVLAVHLETPEGHRITMASTHLPVATSFRQRGRFLSQLQSELTDPFYDGPLVLSGDMNHYPGPKRADVAFRRSVGLTAVDMTDTITWPSRKTSFAHRQLERLAGGQLDDILFRGHTMDFEHRDVVDVASDHRAVVATFTLTAIPGV